VEPRVRSVKLSALYRDGFDLNAGYAGKCRGLHGGRGRVRRREVLAIDAPSGRTPSLIMSGIELMSDELSSYILLHAQA
jgi:hypothetical protein